MLHANEAWRQLTGAELQKGVSTGLWESFEFLSAQALVRLPWPHISVSQLRATILSVHVQRLHLLQLQQWTQQRQDF